MKFSRYLLLLFITFITVQCSSDDGGEVDDEPQRLRGSWSSYWPHLFHDGDTVMSQNFIIYSDKSSRAWREQISDLAERSYVRIKDHLDLDGSEFTFVRGQLDRRIHILTNYDQWNMAVAYRDGFVIRSQDGPLYGGDPITWKKVFEHEMTHVTEFLMIGEAQHQQANSVWMREGFGNYGAQNHRIQTVQQLNDWREKMKGVPGKGNPIEIEIWSHFPQSVRDANTTVEYYGFFELAVRYLVDEQNGNGTNIDNLKDYFNDLGRGMERHEAFEKHFGMTMFELRNNFWDIMEDYLGD